MTTTGNNVFKVLDKETGEYRPIKYKDIVILLRATKNWSESLLDELGQEGIPAYAELSIIQCRMFLLLQY